ncbi:nuclease (SNase domain-containing protein) [[Leptolyngbya] sp. PCC 7376]|uniref:thermonuclease family protein n=1 Tax=[Leptolyngbya] sp. PCC 7376 TaxID=111781 RepID=UPI00029F4610|nr:thermonuclease family protein [[Leptolyngbya] sp. PCC 7376]AFY40022.1 nuclease (SNase domain-containing protein) [[Leptolyngbya] sp. PCC 7376]
MLRTLATVLSLLVVASGFPLNAAELLKGKVVKITYGDTLNAQVGNSTVRVRLACIDTPEKDQNFGSLATQRLNQLVPVGSTVDIYKVDTDRYGRTIGVIVGSSGNVNLQMVREGYAVVYDQYLYNCPNSRNDLLNAENQAKANSRVFWSQSNPCMPWDFRRNRC